MRKKFHFAWKQNLMLWIQGHVFQHEYSGLSIHSRLSAHAFVCGDALVFETVCALLCSMCVNTVAHKRCKDYSSIRYQKNGEVGRGGRERGSPFRLGHSHFSTFQHTSIRSHFVFAHCDSTKCLHLAWHILKF